MGACSIRASTRLTKGTGGRYEALNSETRLSTLLPEYGKQIARSHQRQSHQYRITCQPTGAGVPKQIVANTILGPLLGAVVRWTYPVETASLLAAHNEIVTAAATRALAH